MANSFPYRKGPTELVSLPVDSGTVIERGDMVFLDTDDVKPASDFTFDTNEATTQAGFAAQFVGIAHEASADGDTDPITVDQSAESIYEFTVVSATYEFGDDLGPTLDTSTSPDELKDQELKAAAAATSAIARCFKRSGGATTSLYVKFAGAYNLGGNNTNAVVG